MSEANREPTAGRPASRTGQGLLDNRFVILLATLALLLLAMPFLRALFPGLEGRLLVRLTGIFFTVILFSALFAVSRSPATVLTAMALLVASLAVDVGLQVVEPTVALANLGDGFEAAYLFICVLLIVRRIFHVHEVTFDTISASLCAYLLLGLAWGLLYAMIARVDPTSFASATFAADGGFLAEGRTIPIYFSLVTLATLGYGDIVPVTPSVRLLASGEAIFGQIYLAVLVARLVGLHVSTPRSATVAEA